MNLNKNTLAFLVLASVVAGLGIFVRGTVGGTSEFVGQALGMCLMLFLFFGLYSKIRSRPVRGDLVFLFAAAILLLTNRHEIAVAYDTRQFQADVRAAGPENLAAAVQQSNTKLARTLRAAMNSRAEVEQKLAGIFESLFSPELDSILAPQSVMDASKLQKVLVISNERQVMLQEIPEQIDKIIANQRDELFKIAKDTLGDKQAKDFIKGYDAKLPQYREFTNRRIEVYNRLFQTSASASQWLLKNFGSYQIGPNGKILFGSQSTLDTFNQYVASIQKVAEDEASLDQEILAAQNENMKSGYNKLVAY